jgi:glycosyltransferase involved in cell wall biosynthesis
VAESGAHRRLLLVSTNYAPEPAGTSRYATQIAEHWAAGGDEVHVLTGLPHYPAWRIDRAYAGVRRAEEERGGVTVHRHSHTVPARQTPLRRAVFEASLLSGGLRAAPGIGRPDAVAAQMPSLAAGVIGARLAARHAVPFVPLVRNLLGGRSAVARAIERYALRRAALVGVTHETLAAEVAALGVPERRIRLVPNWSLIPGPSRPRSEMRALLGWRPGQTVLLCAGDLGAGQGLDVLIAAARLDPTLRVVLMGEGDQRERLRALAGGMPNVDFAPLADEAELPDMLSAADVLAVTDRGVPPELTSYFAAGRPVVAAVPADSGTAREVTRTGAGAVVPPAAPPALLAAVRSLAAAPPRSATATPLTREAALTHLDALLAEVLAPAVAPAVPPRPTQPPAAGSAAPEPEGVADRAAPVPERAVASAAPGEACTPVSAPVPATRAGTPASGVSPASGPAVPHRPTQPPAAGSDGAAVEEAVPPGESAPPSGAPASTVPPRPQQAPAPAATVPPRPATPPATAAG